MSLPPRRIPPPGASKKRKDREPFYNPAPLPNIRVTTSPKPTTPNSFFKPPALPLAVAEAKGRKPPHDPPTIDNRVLAGYMANEFLTRGTILGQRFDPGRAEAGEPRRKPGEAEESQSKGKEEEGRGEKHPSYGDVAGLLRKDGVHIPGVFNPSQLLTWLRQ